MLMNNLLSIPLQTPPKRDGRGREILVGHTHKQKETSAIIRDFKSQFRRKLNMFDIKSNKTLQI